MGPESLIIGGNPAQNLALSRSCSRLIQQSFEGEGEPLKDFQQESGHVGIVWFGFLFA